MLQFIIRRKVTIAMLFIGMTLLGYISYRNLAVELLPNAELPYLIIQVGAAQEMDPEIMEKEAIIPLEGVIGSLEGIEEIKSYADRRRGTIFVTYSSDVNLKYAYLRLQEQVDGIKATLNDQFFVSVFKVDTEQIANMFMNLELRGGGGSDRLRHIAENEILEKLESIDGIANIEIYGGSEYALEVVLDREICEAYQITPATVAQLIRTNNQGKTYAGNIEENGKRYFINVVADYGVISDIGNIVVNPRVPVLLKDIAEINRGVREETTISRINGMEAITIQLIRDTQVNLLELSDATHRQIEKINTDMAERDIALVVQFDSAEYLRENIDLIINLAIIGALLAILILWFFLHNLPLVSVIALAIPVSVFTSFNLFYAFDITLNSLTLVGMALAIGMLLDNSIVVLENIYRLVTRKKDIDRAVLQGSAEVWRSILAATLTTVIVFLPFIFAENFFVRILGYQIGVSIISTLFVSLVVALMLIPMITHFFLSRYREKIHFKLISARHRIMQIYVVFLKTAMRKPLQTVVTTVIIFLASLLIALAVSVNVSQETELQEFNLYVTMPKGATLETTDAAVADLEEMLKDVPELQDIISQIYEEEAVLTLKLKEDFAEINDLDIGGVKEVINRSLRRFRIAEVSFEQPLSSSRFRRGGRQGSEMNMPGGNLGRLMGVGRHIEKVVIKGQNDDLMRIIADDIRFQLEELNSVDWARVDVAEDRPEIHLLYDRQAMEFYEIPVSALTTELSSFRNEISTEVPFKLENEQIDVVVRMDAFEERDSEDLRNLPVPNEHNVTFPLERFSRIVYSQGESAINRINQVRQIEISYRFISEVTDDNTFLESARGEIDQIIAAMEIPAGIAVNVVHDDSDLSDFYFLTVVALLLIYMVLASVFESLISPFIIMFTIPLAAIGSLWLIIFTANSLLNANTLIGFLILLGIVVNNGIILIDYTRLLRQGGYNRARALIVAGKARLRPILITAITTIAAMLPLAMGQAEYVSQIAAPFAITVIGGLALSTVFTLIFMPTVYSGLEGFLRWFKNLDWKLKLIQFAIIIAGSFFIFTEIESVIWRVANFFLLLFAVPALLYFILTSLRQARADLIAEKEPIHISVNNLYKIYDHPSRFIREWRKGRRTVADEDKSRSELRISLVWQMLLLAFAVYFIYFYQPSELWFFILLHPLYFYGFFLLKQSGGAQSAVIRIKSKWHQRLQEGYLWGVPLINLIIMFLRWDQVLLPVVIGILWYFALTVYKTSHRLHHRKVNINRLTGRLAGLRKRFYRLVQIIPVIGKRKIPFTAVKGVSLEIGRGMFGLLGPNGAGKTTLMRVICGILDQNYGYITINGIDTRDKREELQGLIGYLPQEFGMYENMTAEEFLSYQAILKGLTGQQERKERVDYVLSAVHLQEKRHDKIASYSGGMKQRIGIAQTLLHLPRILVVDEPTAGLDPRERIRFRNLLVHLSRERVVIFSTHIIEDIASSCDRVAVMNKGEVRYLGDPQGMTRLASGNVYQFLIDPKEFDSIRKKYQIVHHIRVEDKIRVRCLSSEKPSIAGAQAVRPTLEDGYLWLAGEMESNGKEA